MFLSILFCITFTLLSKVSVAEDTNNVPNYSTFLDVQFLNETEEVKLSQNIHHKFEKSNLKDWYKVSVAKYNPDIGNHWIKIKNGTNLGPNQLEHGFYEVKFSTPVPFYGRYLDRVIVTTAGGLLTGNMNEPLLTPSFIAPFLSTMEPTESDSVEYYDKLHLGGDFVVQWDKHIKNNDKYRLKVQLRILLDGTFIFVYQHFTEEAKDIFETDKYPIMIGLNDGFSISVEKDEKDIQVYTYPDFVVDSEEIVGPKWSMISFVPEKEQCKTKSTDQCSGECIRCDESCMHQFELHRPGSPCHSDDECHDICPMNYAPVCGSDGNTYSNKCLLQAKACSDKQKIEIVKEKSCDDKKDDDTKTDKNQDEESDIISTTECKECDKTVSPICGSDNQTYINECVLNQQNCLQKTSITKIANQPCQVLEYKQDKSDDDEDEDVAANCDKKCEEMMQPICLNKVRNFNSKCIMDIAVCEESIQVETIDDGYCQKVFSGKSTTTTENETSDEKSEEEIVEKCQIKECSSSEDDDNQGGPVCGSDNMTYDNLCLLENTNCQQGLDISVKSQGQCQVSKNQVEEEEKSDNNNKEKKCETACTREFFPICGSDGKTYNNKCLLKVATCLNPEVELKSHGPCDPEKFNEAAALDTKASLAAKQEQNGQEEHEHVTFASANHLGTITVLTVGILLAIMFVGYQMRKRNRILNHRPNPMTMTVNEFRDEEMGGTELPPSSSASFPVNGNTSGSGVGGNNWRRPPNNDRLTLVEHMEQNR